MQATIKERFPGIAVMRSIPVPPPGAADRLPITEVARHFEMLTDYFLIDTLLMAGETVAGQPECGFVGITGGSNRGAKPDSGNPCRRTFAGKRP